MPSTKMKNLWTWALIGDRGDSFKNTINRKSFNKKVRGLGHSKTEVQLKASCNDAINEGGICRGHGYRQENEGTHLTILSTIMIVNFCIYRMMCGFGGGECRDVLGTYEEK